MPELKITITNEVGLHARPLALFVQTAKQFESEIQVANLSSAKGPSNGKSPLNLLLLAVHSGMEINVSADGPDAEQALAALKELIETKINK